MAPSTSRAFVLARARAGLITVVMGGAACQQILDIPEDPPSATAFESVLCSCSYLLVQGAEFETRCVDSIEDIETRTNAGEQAAKDQLLLLAGSDCANCENVQSCYDLATGALTQQECEAVAETQPLCCGGSSQCASWACCTSELVARTEGPNNEVVIRFDRSSCCEKCNGCAQLFDGSRENFCADSMTTAERLFTCVGPKKPLCVGACAGDPQSVACIDCLLEPSSFPQACMAEYQACELDQSRPRPLND